MNPYWSNPLIFILQFTLGAYAFIVLIRFFLQSTRADFYHPLSQFILQLTQPVLRHFRRWIPSYAGLDIAALVLAWLCYFVLILLVFWIQSGQFAPLLAALIAVPKLIGAVIDLFFYAIILQAILSWIDPYGQNPLQRLLYPLTKPVLRPFRRWIKPIAGIDLSPIFALFALSLLKMLLLPPFYSILNH